MGIECDERKTIVLDGEERHFRIVTYQAYSAFGLIGPEMNGIAIFDLDQTSVLLDGLLREPTGYYGASIRQKEYFYKLVELCAEDFRDVVNFYERSRHKI